MIIKRPWPTELTEGERRLRCWVVSGDALVVGDHMVLMGVPYRILRFAPYQGLIPQPPGTRDVFVAGIEPAFMVAEPKGRYRILPREHLPELPVYPPPAGGKAFAPYDDDGPDRPTVEGTPETP